MAKITYYYKGIPLPFSTDDPDFPQEGKRIVSYLEGLSEIFFNSHLSAFFVDFIKQTKIQKLFYENMLAHLRRFGEAPKSVKVELELFNKTIEEREND